MPHPVAALKNTLDHCYREWAGKPLLVVTYGGDDGDKCAAQLRQVAEGLKMRLVPTMPGLTLARVMIEGGPINPAADFVDQRAQIQAGCQSLVSLLTTG